MTGFAQQVAVVTGASSGIGRAIALGLGAQGAQLCLVGRRQAALQAVADALGPPAAPPRSYLADLAAQADIDALAQALLRDAAGIDVLVHAAGLLRLAALEAATATDLDEQYRTNLRAPYVLTHKLLPALRARQGQVLFVNSSAGVAARANAAAYAMTKHGLKALADTLREEVNAAGVRVTSVFLGRTATPMQAAVHAAEGRPYRPELLMQPEDVAAMAIHALALPRSIEVTEISMRPLRKSY